MMLRFKPIPPEDQPSGQLLEITTIFSTTMNLIPLKGLRKRVRLDRADLESIN